MKFINNYKSKLVVISAFLLAVISCGGGSKNTGQGFPAATPSVNTNLGLEGSGNYTANSIEQFRNLVRQGSFPRSIYRFGTMEKYALLKGSCDTVYNDFLWMDNIPSTQCNSTSSSEITEYSDGRVLGHPHGGSKEVIINNFLSMIDTASSVHLVDDAGKVLYGGYPSSKIRLNLVENGEEKYYFLDLRRPLASNPANKFVQSVSNTSGAYDLEVIQYAYPQ